MARPYQRMTAVELEVLFVQAEGDLGKLEKIEHELKRRSVPSALRLLEAVQKEKAKLSGDKEFEQLEIPDFMAPVVKSRPAQATSTNTPVPKQAGLGLDMPGFDIATGGVGVDSAVVTPASKKNLVTAPSAPTRNPIVQVSVLAKAVLPAIELTTEQAYRMLKVPATANWELIEASRGALVAKAQPDKIVALPPTQRAALQEEARQVNAAYKLLLQLRAAE